MIRLKLKILTYPKHHPVKITLKLHCLEALILNNLGVHYFRANKIDLAEVTWRKARRLSRENSLPWIQVLAEINLSDIYALKGKLRVAKDLLRSARSFMEEVGDMEGVSEVDFNLALVSISEGKKERAEYYFRKVEEFPLTYKTKMDERVEEMRKRFETKGWIWKST